MRLRLVVQTNNNSGVKVLQVTEDFDTPVGDFLVTSPGWEDCQIVDQPIIILTGEELILEHLVDKTLWVEGDSGEVPFNLNRKNLVDLQCMIRKQLSKEN